MTAPHDPVAGDARHLRRHGAHHRTGHVIHQAYEMNTYKSYSQENQFLLIGISSTFETSQAQLSALQILESM
jgi:hypothetical protein